eukprot:7829602-Karenia_brevis.AAC.1
MRANHRAGDWICPGCGDCQFQKNMACRLCSHPRPDALAVARSSVEAKPSVLPPSMQSLLPTREANVASVNKFELRALNMPGADVRVQDCVFSLSKSCEYMNAIVASTPWHREQTVVDGKFVTESHRTCLFGDSPGTRYRYSVFDKSVVPWVPEILQIKAVVEQIVVDAGL